MRTRMLAIAIATGLVATPFGATAKSSAPDTAGNAAQIAQLEAQLAALQSRIADLERREATQPVAVPTAQPDTGHRLDALEELVDNTHVGGKMYANFTQVNQTSNGVDTDASGIGLDVTRFYLTIDHTFNDIWSANLTTDFNYESNDGETQLYVKKAYVQGKFSELATLRVGSASTPWIPFVEDWYGYRYIEKTLVDRADFGDSADWGVHLKGGSGMFNYQVSAINGAGYKNPSRSNHVDFTARVGVQPIDGLMLGIGLYNGDLGEDTATTPALHTAQRYDAMAAWHHDGLRLGAEWFTANNWNDVLTPANDSASGWSAWGSYDFGPAALFARYDRVKPSKDLDPSLTDTYWNAGVSFPVTNGVKIAVAYKHEHLRNDTSIDVETREIGVWGEAKW